MMHQASMSSLRSNTTFAFKSVNAISRPTPALVVLDSGKEAAKEKGFVVKMHEDIPKNRLTEKLAKGLQKLVVRMQRREGFRIKVEIQEFNKKAVLPKPRECATLTSVHSGCTDAYLIGGQSADCVSEVLVAKV